MTVGQRRRIEGSRRGGEWAIDGRGRAGGAERGGAGQSEEEDGTAANQTGNK